jgi:hypothetical protein
MLSGGKAEAFRKRLQMGMEWDKKRKSWKLKGGQKEQEE